MKTAGGLRALVDLALHAERASLAASEVRRNLPGKSSRARLTTANARWSRAAEERDRVQAELRALSPELSQAVRKLAGLEQDEVARLIVERTPPAQMSALQAEACVALASLGLQAEPVAQPDGAKIVDPTASGRTFTVCKCGETWFCTVVDRDASGAAENFNSDTPQGAVDFMRRTLNQRRPLWCRDETGADHV